MDNIFFIHAIIPMILATIITLVCLILGLFDVFLTTKIKTTICFSLWILIFFIFSIASLAIFPL